MFVTAARQTNAPTAFSKLHKEYVMSLYRRFLRDSHDWHIRGDLWRQDAQRIRAEFEHNRHVKNPRELAAILNKAEEQLASRKHPDPYRRTYRIETDPSAPTYVGGTKWERNLPPRMFSDEEKTESLKDQRV